MKLTIEVKGPERLAKIQDLKIHGVKIIDCVCEVSKEEGSCSKIEALITFIVTLKFDVYLENSRCLKEIEKILKASDGL